MTDSVSPRVVGGGPGHRQNGPVSTVAPPSGSVLKRLFIGRKIASAKQEHQLLPKTLALPIFSSDALSSNAYATEEMMLVLTLAGAGALSLMLPIAGAIALLLAIVVLSYQQTVRAYPHGGGSYIVAKENLGTVPGLLAGAALLTDYVMTVAVSVTAGTYAVVSAFPAADAWRVEIAVGFVLFITLLNLRGVKEAGVIFAVPTYGFVVMVFITLAVGFFRCIGGCPQAASATEVLEVVHPISLFLIARAFSSGATALTGVEAISNGVPAFRRPQPRNAGITLFLMGGISASMFLGITFLARGLGVRVSEALHGQQSVLAQIGETVYGGGWPFFALQTFTAGILVLAANTAYQDFPRLAAILSADRFLPSQFRNRGDRLVFSNGVLVLATAAIGLVVAFDAELTRLIQLYVVGVFTAFTLSQAGMVRHWFVLRGTGWRRAAIVNAIGGVTTGIVLVVVTITKFTHGAWIVIVAFPIIVAAFLATHRHYERVGRLLRSRHLTGALEPDSTFVLLVPDLELPTLGAIGYLRALRPDRVIPLWTGPQDAFATAAEAWRERAPRLGDLVPLPGAEDRPIRALRAYLRTLPRTEDAFLTVVVSEEVPEGGSLLSILRERRALRLKGALLFERGVVVTDVPLLAEERAAIEASAARPTEPSRSVVLVPVSAIHDATVRAVLYARSLRASVTEALFLTADPTEIEGLVEDWHERDLGIPLVVAEAPFRDFGSPLVEEIRKYTGRGDTVVTVVLPEFIPGHWWENLLHNQTAFYFKRLLLREPEVVVTSVPFHLADEIAPEAEGSAPVGA